MSFLRLFACNPPDNSPDPSPPNPTPSPSGPPPPPCQCGICDFCRAIAYNAAPPPEEGGFMRLTPELKLLIFEYLREPSDMRNIRLVCHNFVPRDLSLAVYILDSDKPAPIILFIGLNLSSKSHESVQSEEYSLTGSAHQPHAPRVDSSGRYGFVIEHLLPSLQDVPETLLQKIRFLTVGLRKEILNSSLMVGLPDPSYESLKIIAASSHRLKSFCAIGMENADFRLTQTIVENNKGLLKGTFLRRRVLRADEEDEIDFKWLERCEQLQDLMVMNYPTKDIGSVPPSTKKLILNCPIPLEQVVWISHNMKNLNTLGLKVQEELGNPTFFSFLSNSIPNVKELVTVMDPPGSTGLTPKLLLKLMNLPHLEHLLLDFSLFEKEGDKGADHANLLRKRWAGVGSRLGATPGIRFEGTFEGGQDEEGKHLFNIALHIDRKVFKGW